MTLIEKFLDLPHATLLSYVAIAAAVIGYLTGHLSYEEAVVVASGGVAGAGVLGVARNGAGRGVK